MDLNPAARRLWAQTQLRVHDAVYRLVSLPPGELGAVAEIVGSLMAAFAVLIVEAAEVSLTLPADAWRDHRSRFPGAVDDGPYRVITFDLDVDLSTWGFFAPAAVRLAAAGISIVPQCAFLKDHLLVREQDLGRAVTVLDGMIEECRAAVAVGA